MKNISLHIYLRRRFWILVFVVALAARLVYLIEISGHPLATVPQKGMDQERYWRCSKEIISGDILCGAEAITPPVYHWFLAAVRASPGGSTLAVFIVQSLLGATACVLIYLLARALLDESAAAVAGVLAALFGPFIFYDCVLLRASLAVFLTALLCLIVFHAGRRARADLWALAGFVMAACVFLQENLLAYLPFAVLYIVYSGRQNKQGPATLVFTCVFLLGAAVAACPFFVRNAMLDRPAFQLSGSGPIALVYGNSPDSAPYGEVIPASFRETMEAAGGSTMGAVKHLARAAVSRPGPWLKNELLKFAAYWNAYEVPCNLNYYLFAQISMSLRLNPFTFGLVSPLGIAGMVLLFRKRRHVFVLYCMTAACVLSVVPFYVISRLRLPVAVPLIVFSAYTITGLVRMMTSRNARGALLIALLIAVTALFTAKREPVPIRSNDYFNLGNALRGEGRNEEAALYYRKALVIEPAYSAAHLNLGNIHMENGGYAPALGHYRAALKKTKNEAAVRGNIAVALLALGREDEAAGEWQRMLELAPGNKTAAENLRRYGGKK